MNVDNDNISLAPSLRQRIAQAPAEPPADLWARIEAAHFRRVRHRRVRRWTACSVGVVVLLVGVVVVSPHRASLVQSGEVEIDWQARAEALELQWHALDSKQGTSGTPTWNAEPAEVELGDLDRRLQLAYERAARKSELAALWKHRSELLDSLILARKQGLVLTHI